VKGADTVAEFGEPVLVADRTVVLPLDARGPRIGTPHGSMRLATPVDGAGVTELPGLNGGGLGVTTWGKPTNYVLLYSFGQNRRPLSTRWAHITCRSRTYRSPAVSSKAQLVRRGRIINRLGAHKRGCCHHEATAGGRGSLRSPDPALESEDEAFHPRR